MPDTDSITIIGRGAHIKGEITFDTPARILGTIEGTVFSKTELYIGETAHCKAAVHAAAMLVDGDVEGSLIATDRIELTAKCCVKGDITTGSLVVADGASFMGYCRVGPGAIAEQSAASERAPLQLSHEQSPRGLDRSHQAINTTPNNMPNTMSGTMSGNMPHAAASGASGGNVHTNGHTRAAPDRPIADRIVIPDKPGVEVKNQPVTQPRPRARTADWLPPATPAFPSVVTKATDWNGSTASA